MIPYPAIDPIAFSIGPLAVRWYSLSYLAGIVGGWYYLRWWDTKHALHNLTTEALDNLIFVATLGIIIGGRVGYVLFYQLDYYVNYPSHIFRLWEGGMSFHGGLIGLVVAVSMLCSRYDVSFLGLMDRISLAAPIGIGLGRIANFINGELYGRIASPQAPFAMIFPRGGDMPRHPSQLYEAASEGLLLFVGLFIAAHYKGVIERRGSLSGLFLIGYALARSSCELFREPDVQLGFLIGGLTMGQLLCIPMLLLGVVLLLGASRQRA